MKIVVQRVKEAYVTVEGQYKNSIAKGLVLLVGVGRDDTPEMARTAAQKISGLRIFEDGNGKMNLDIMQIGGEVLSVPQFTLLADTAKGNRPGFDDAASPEKAKSLWEEFNAELRRKEVSVKTGEFGARMDVSLINNGPVTFVIDAGRGTKK
jgi:D-tyrosyl-tRNA(Tyr) deacylase